MLRQTRDEGKVSQGGGRLRICVVLAWLGLAEKAEAVFFEVLDPNDSCIEVCAFCFCLPRNMSYRGDPAMLLLAVVRVVARIVFVILKCGRQPDGHLLNAKTRTSSMRRLGAY